jgi:hypothetical protein
MNSEIITSGVAFVAPVGRLPICRNMPLRAKLMDLDARSGQSYQGPCKLLLDMATKGESFYGRFAPGKKAA